MPKLRVITKMPPEPHGEPEQQVAQLRDYLLQLCEELAYLLTHLESDNINDSTFQRIQEMIPRAGTNLPAMDGEASTGSMAAWARSDHRHPSDESKADVTALEETAGELADHVADIGNPHEVTAAQVGLGNVANERQYSAENPPPTPSAAAVGAIPATDKGNAGGVAELDANGMVPSAQLPSYVDDVLEYASLSDFPATGESGKIYAALDTNLTYRWSGSAYVEISPSLALGETSSTAYRGDRGKTAYDHSQLTSGNPHRVTAAEVGARPDTWMPTASDVGAQSTITASGMLKGDGLGGVSAATAGTDYQAPLTAGVDYQTPLVADVDYQTPLVAGTDYQTPLAAGTDYQTPLAAGTDYQTPLVADVDYQTPLTAGTDYQTPLTAGTDYATPGMIPAVPDPSDATPQALGTAAAGSSDDYSRADHVHEKPTYTASDVGLGNVDNVQQYSVNNPPPVPDAEDIPYDNSTSGLTATDLQAAVDELAQGGSATASAVSYDNTSSGLLATDVQDAIDELANGGGGSTPAASVIPYDNTGSGLTANNVQDAIDEVLGEIPSSPSDIGAQASVTASGILMGDGAGNISAAVAGTDYQEPLVAGTDYQTPLTAGTDYQTPLTAGTDYQTPLVAGTDYATPGMIPSVPSASSATPQALGTAAAGSSGNYSRADHVHQKPSAADIGAYVKPSGGIPSSDMASGVQTSLGLADSAYQLPSGGIPASDLASGVIPTVPSAYTSNPAMDGTASPGSSGAWAKGDHVHPSDTSKANSNALGKELHDPAGQNVAYGEYCTYQGNIYIANTAITSSMSASTFISYLDPVNNGGLNLLYNQLAGLSEDVATFASGISGTKYIRKRNSIVTVELNNISGLTGHDSVIMTLSQGFRPKNNINFMGFIRSGTGWATATLYPASLYIDTNGVVRVSGNSSQIASGNFYGNATYMI